MTLENGLRRSTTPIAPPSAPIAATKNMTCSNHIRLRPSLALPAERRALGVRREQHLLREQEIGARVVGELVVDAHRDRVERARDLAVAAEDAARHVDLVDRGVALAGRDLVLGRVLRRHDANALGRARGGAQRAADALLEPRVLEALQLVLAAEARVHRRLLLGVLHRDRSLAQPPEGRREAAQRLAECAVGAADAAGLGAALDLDHVLGRVPGRHGRYATTTIAVTRALSVASGRSTFHPNAISWS